LKHAFKTFCEKVNFTVTSVSCKPRDSWFAAFPLIDLSYPSLRIAKIVLKDIQW
jgi:hypothetical protein